MSDDLTDLQTEVSTYTGLTNDPYGAMLDKLARLVQNAISVGKTAIDNLGTLTSRVDALDSKAAAAQTAIQDLRQRVSALEAKATTTTTPSA